MSSQSVTLLAQETRPVQSAQQAHSFARADGATSFSQVLRTSTVDRAPSPVRERPGSAREKLELGRAEAPGQRIENHGRIRSAEAHEAASARREARESGRTEPAERPSDTSPTAADANSGDTPPSSSAADGAATPGNQTPGSENETTTAAEIDAATQEAADESSTAPVEIMADTSLIPVPETVVADGEPAALDATTASSAQPAPSADPAAQQFALAAGIAAAAAETADQGTGPGHALNAPRATPSSKSAAFAGPPGLLKKADDAGGMPGDAALPAISPGTVAFEEAAEAAVAETAAGGSEIALAENGAGEKPAAGQETFKAAVFDLPPPLPVQISPSQASGSAAIPTAALSDSLRPGAAQAAPTPLAMLPVEIGMRALEGAQRFEIRLHPEEYGRVDVRLDVDNDGGVKAHLLVDRVDTLAMLQRDAKTLERAFEQAGLKTGDGALQFSLSQGGDQGQRGGRQQADTPPPAWQEQAARSDLQAALRSITAPTGAVDIRI